MFEHYQQESQLRRLVSAKAVTHSAGGKLGMEVVQFFKQSVDKRQRKFGKIAACWSQMVPENLAEHCALESLHRGSLTVIVDSASHLYELKQMLLGGLEKQLKLACQTGLKKVLLKPGRWYEGKDTSARVRF
jgi:aminoglycoside phosphotransferase family enzyme